ncbi:fungal-specific transcription factor domain-containing protein [Phaeosphaeriaceae sp. PMI808]|nr:fungal-specific transcription factor domain-containing protein [Phaeosphaeriaceae sp. PMI808]
MSSEPPRKRAKLACVTCNARRVKCDVTDRHPCGNCFAANILCETRESRRGKHPRKPRTETDGRDATSPQTILSPERHEDEVAASHVLASLSTNFQHPADARINQFQFASPSVPSESQGVSTKTETPRQEDDAAVFLGESSSLRYVTEEPSPADPTAERRHSLFRFRHSVPNAAKEDAMVPEWEAERRRTRMKALQAEGTFTFPPIDVRLELLRAYFQWFHSHFAVIDEADFWEAHQSNTVSPLLLQAMLFIGVIHCEESTLTTLGWGNRHRAKWLFYIRAKDIYDATYETNKVTVIQSLFLMSFWRAGALLEKDARHWLGTAISLAQTKALHRSGEDCEEKILRLRRRLWWAIYVRERQCGSALGLPNRIRDEDCDIVPLSASDFTSAFSPSSTTSDSERCTAYIIGMTQLAIFLGQIVDAGYLPNRSLNSTDRTRIRSQIYTWRDQLPSIIRLHSDATDEPNFQASTLQLACNNLLILLYRSSFIIDDNGSAESDGSVALQAAARNSRIVEDLLPSSNIGHAQIHVITNLFNTLCIHVAHLRRSAGVNRTLAEHRAKLCLMGLQELQKTWEVTNWVLQLFFRYLDRTTATRLTMEADDVGFSSAASRTPSGRGSSGPTVQHTPKIALNHGLASEVNQAPVTSNEVEPGSAWSWSMDEANQYLFSQIENGFAFGEGGMQSWSPNDLTANGALADYVYSNLNG